MKTYSHTDFAQTEFETIVRKIPQCKIALIGDLCLDVYWHADMTRSELSRETPHHPLPITEERFSLGGAANVAANLRSLGVEALSILSVLAKDWRGQILRELLDARQMATQQIVEVTDMVTPAYCKPIRHGISDVSYEDPRLDFANYQPLPTEAEAALLATLDELDVDVLAVSDQLAYGCITDPIRDKISELGRSLTVIVDSRDKGQLYNNVILKPNEVEAAALTGEPTLTDPAKTAATIRQQSAKPLLLTLGAKGAFYTSDTETFLAEAFPVEPPLDFVGAGDTFLAAFTAATATGASARTAVQFANLASAVTIKAIGTTGVATHTAMLKKLRNEH